MRDISGMRFGRLVAVSFSHKDKHGACVWNVLCDCGEIKTVAASNLFGKTKSCGCLKKQLDKTKLVTHGLSGTRTHRIWKGIIARCNIESATGFENYGGRGVRVCKQWLDYANFFNDMGPAPEGMSIDRIDVNGDYTIENCKWSSRIEQSRNRRTNRLIDVAGKKTVLSEAASLSEMRYDAIRFRLNRGWSSDEAVSAKKNTKKRSKKIAANGTEKTIREWADHLKMTPGSLRLRIKNGWSEYEAVTTPKGGVRNSHEAVC